MNLYLCESPLAATGLISYRCQSLYGGWIMIGAKNFDDAMSEASRADRAKLDTLQIWDGAQYVNC